MDYKVIVTKRRLNYQDDNIRNRLVVGWLSAIFTRGCLYTLWGVTSADTEPKRICMDYDYKCLCNVERCYLPLFLRHDLPRNTPTSDER